MIKKIIIAALLILASLSFLSTVQADNQQGLIFMTLNYNNNQVTVKEMALGNGFYMPFAEDANVRLDKCLLKASDKNEQIFETSFYVENKRFEDIINPYSGDMTGTIQELNDVDFAVIIPYFKALERIEITCPSNRIVLNRTNMNFKQFAISVYGEERNYEQSEEVVIEYQATQNNTFKSNYSSSTNTNSNEGKKSIFLQLVEVIKGVFYYIFG